MKNTGSRAGKAVAQLYVAAPEMDVLRPVRELKGFEKVHLEPGEAKDVSFTLDKRSFAYWNETLHDWHVVSGKYAIQIGASSRDLPLCAAVDVTGTAALPKHYDMNSIFMDILADPRAAEILKPFISKAASALTPDPDEASSAATEAISGEMGAAMLNYMPLRTALSFSGGQVSEAQINALLEALNQ